MRQLAAMPNVTPSGARQFFATIHAIGAVWAAMQEAKALVAASVPDDFPLRNKSKSWIDHIRHDWCKFIKKFLF